MSDQDRYGLDDRRKHLDMVQAVVSRMASSSSTSKGWLLPVVTATYGFALVQRVPLVGVLGLTAIAVFGVLDGHYLRQERAFRVLFRDIARGQVGGYDMNASRYFHKPNGDENDERDENCRWWHVICSWALLGFYGPLAAVGFAVIVCASLPC